MTHPRDTVDFSVNIKLNKRSIERIVYWVIIIVLAILLIISYVGDKDCSSVDEDMTNVIANDNGLAENTNDADTAPLNTTPVNDGNTKDDDLIGLPPKIDVQPEPDPEPEPEPDPEPEPVTLSGKIEFAVPASGVKVDDLGDGKVKITQLLVQVTNGKAYAIDSYKVIVYAYGDDETAAPVKSKERVEKDGFVVPATKSGEETEMKLDLSSESIFNVDNAVVFKVKLFDDRNSLIDSISFEKKV